MLPSGRARPGTAFRRRRSARLDGPEDRAGRRRRAGSARSCSRCPSPRPRERLRACRAAVPRSSCGRAISAVEPARDQIHRVSRRAWNPENSGRDETPPSRIASAPDFVEPTQFAHCDRRNPNVGVRSECGSASHRKKRRCSMSRRIAFLAITTLGLMAATSSAADKASAQGKSCCCAGACCPVAPAAACRPSRSRPRPGRAAARPMNAAPARRRPRRSLPRPSPPPAARRSS